MAHRPAIEKNHPAYRHHLRSEPADGLDVLRGLRGEDYNHRGDGGWARDWHGNLTGKRRPKRDEYNCSTYNLGRQRYKTACTQHYIRTEAVRELVLGTLRAVSGFVRENEDEFIRRVREDSAVKQAETARAHKRRLTREEKRCAELNTIIKKLYEDNISGKLPDKRFQMLCVEYEQEQAALEQSISRLQEEIASFETDSVRADKFIKIVKKHTDFTELMTPMLNEFVEKIVVHEGDYSSGERVQRVDIYLNFIGRFDVSPLVPTAEELSEEAERQRKREKKREYIRRYMEKKRQREREENIQKSA